MKLLIVTGAVYPQCSNNTNLVLKLIPFLERSAEIRILSIVTPETLPEQPVICAGYPVDFASEKECSAIEMLKIRAAAKINDRGGLSDEYHAGVLLAAMKRIAKTFPFDAVFVSVEPFAAACVFFHLSNGIRKAAYVMDPTIYQSEKLKYRRKMLPKIVNAADLIITTPFIREEMLRTYPNLSGNNITSVGFPMICGNEFTRTEAVSEKIRLLFCGWLYSDIRSPKFFLEIVSSLDEKFEVIFMGKECDKLPERFPIVTKAKLITLPNQPYEVALQAMQDADILINIGNSVPVHMPSKTLEYINTGKPFVNFYKMEKCPTLYYTRRYPLCLNIFEGDNVEFASKRFTDFCLTMKGRTVDRTWIEEEYKDCTPGYIAQKILENLGD